VESTYNVQSRDSGRITPQQETNHFSMATRSGMVDGKLSILILIEGETIHDGQANQKVLRECEKGKDHTVKEK